jgi:DNA-binding LacI/PurR family transcriptional regulator
LGYGLESIWLHDPGMTPARLTALLDARRIRGLVISAPPERSALPDRYDFLWRRIPCVVAGSSPASPALNFSTNDHFSTASHGVERLWERGWRRIGLVLSPGLDASVDRRFGAGFWAGQEALGGCGRLPVFPFHETRKVAFQSWYARHRPDAILSAHEEVREWIGESRLDIPGTVGLAHLDLHDGLPDWSGMNQNDALVGAAAIEMLIGQVHRNEIGLPDSPKASFIRSTWIDGVTADRCAAASTNSREAALV